MSAQPSLLLYRDTCPKCRLLSRLAVLLAMGGIDRVPLSSPRARLLTAGDPQRRGQLTLVGRSGRATGWGVLPAAFVATVEHLLTRRGQS